MAQYARYSTIVIIYFKLKSYFVESDPYSSKIQNRTNVTIDIGASPFI